MARECPTLASALNQSRGNRGNVAHPLPVTATPANSKPLTFPPQPWMKASQHEGDQMNRPMRSHPSHSFFESRPNCPLVGQSNKVPVIIAGQKVTVLIDSGEQVSSVSSGFCEHMTLKVHPLGRLLELEGTRGSAIPNLGYIEVNL